MDFIQNNNDDNKENNNYNLNEQIDKLNIILDNLNSTTEKDISHYTNFTKKINNFVNNTEREKHLQDENLEDQLEEEHSENQLEQNFEDETDQADEIDETDDINEDQTDDINDDQTDDINEDQTDDEIEYKEQDEEIDEEERAYRESDKEYDNMCKKTDQITNLVVKLGSKQYQSSKLYKKINRFIDSNDQSSMNAKKQFIIAFNNLKNHVKKEQYEDFFDTLETWLELQREIYEIIIKLE